MSIILGRRATIAAILAISASAALAQNAKPGVVFTQAAFDAAQASGKSIVIDVTAPWCPTCKVQAPIINSLMARPDMKAVAVFNVDFDSQKDVLRKLNAQQQSTLIAFRGKKETGRSVGDTTPAGIEKLFKSAI